MSIQKIKAGRVTQVVADEWVGPYGTLFYNEDLGDLRVGDGVTPGGILLAFGGGEGGTYTLPTATTTIKGGVKIDGSTITIANQVISVGTVPYTKLSGTPTIPTNNNQLTNGAAYITSSALTGLATETYVTTRGYITTSALTDYALTSAVPTNNNQLSNGAAYITSSALTGLASETYVTTRGYITSAALSTYALTSAIPTDINQLTDVSGLLGQGGGGGGTTYITNTVENPYSFSIAGDDSTLREIANGESIKFTGAGGITVTTDPEGNVTVTGTPVSLAGYATESYVTSRGYITGLSWNQLTDKPNLAGTYTFNVAADDSTMREISSEETVKFVGAGGITTASDAEGKITITQGTTSSLVNGANTVSLGSTGTVTFPNGALKIAGNTISNYVVNDLGGGGFLAAGSQLEVALAKTVITSGTTSSDGSSLTSQYLFEVNPNKILNAFQIITMLDADSGLTSELITELDNNGFKIGQRVTNDLGGDSEPLVAFSGWTFGTVGQSQAITFPDSTVQTTAWNGTVSQLRSESNIDIEINLSDSTKRTWQFGEDGSLTLPSGNSVISNLNVVGNTSTGSQIQVGNGVAADTGIIISNGTTIDLGDGSVGSSGALVNVNGTTAAIINQAYQSNQYGSVAAQLLVEVSGTIFIGAKDISVSGGETTTNLHGWTFDSGPGTLTFPDATVQTTAWTGIANALRSESNINIEVNLTDSTKRTWQFGEDGYLTLPNDGGINSSANINIAVNTPDSTTLNWQFGNDGYLTLPNDRGITASSNINISVATPDSTTLNWQFGNDGALTLPGSGKITNGDYDWKFDSDGFFNAASILTLGNSGNLYIDKISTSQGFGVNIKQRGFKVDQYNNPITYSATTRKTATGLTPIFTSTADPTSTDYYEVIALLLPNLAANENFTVGIQMPTLNPFAAGWMAAYPDDAKQYKFKLVFQATYVIQGVTYNFTEAYETSLETFGDSSSPTQAVNITTQVYPPLPGNPSGDEITPTVNLDLNPLVAGYVTMTNLGTAFAKARGAAGLVPVQLAVSAGFSRNLDAALVWGRANTGTTLTNPNTSFDGIAYYQGIGDNAIVTDYNYMQMVLGQGYIGFQPNNIQLANGTNIGENLNGSIRFGSRTLDNSLEAVAIGTSYGTIGDYAVAVGYYAGTDSGESAVAIGGNSGGQSGDHAVAVGSNAGGNQGGQAVAIGFFAGTDQGLQAVAVGSGAGNQSGDAAVAVGFAAGSNGQNAGAVAIGALAAGQSQGTYAVAMGYGAGYYGQRDNAVAIGSLAGAGAVYAQAGYVAAGSSGTTLIISRAVYSLGTIVPGMMIQAPGFSTQTVVSVDSATELTISAAPDTAPQNGYPLQFFKGQGANSIAIGNQAGSPAGNILTDFQESNTIILNATGTSLIGVDGQENSFYVAPIRNASGADGLLQYNLTSKEVTYGKLSYNDLLNKPDLAATYTWSIAADDSTLREILANETVKFIGAGSITTASDAEGNITITGAAPDRLTSNARSAVLNANGTFSLPTLTAAPSTPQAGQMALANGTSWDPITQNNGAPYMVIYTGSAWIGMGGGGGGVTMDEVYMAILELGPTTL